MQNETLSRFCGAFKTPSIDCTEEVLMRDLANLETNSSEMTNGHKEEGSCGGTQEALRYFMQLNKENMVGQLSESLQDRKVFAELNSHLQADVGRVERELRRID